MYEREVCMMDGCFQLERGRLGMCNTHYRRYQKYGDAEMTAWTRTPTKEIQRFINEAVLYLEDKCLIWPYAKDNDGYGWFVENGIHIAVHRYICLQEHGPPIGDRNHSAHSCDTPSCVNPSHLRWTTHSENMKDKIK